MVFTKTGVSAVKGWKGRRKDTDSNNREEKIQSS